MEQTILCVITVCTVVSPILVALFNNIHDYKIKKLEFVFKAKQDALVEFAAAIIKNHDINSTAFYQALNKLYIYFDVDDELVQELIKNNHLKLDLYQKNATKLMKKLAKQVPRI